MSRISTQPLADQPLGALPYTTDRGPQPLHWPPVSARRQVHTFHTRARTKLAPPPCRTPPGQSAGSRQAHPGPVLQTRFRRHLSGFDTSSVDRLRSPSWPIPDALDGAPCPQRSPPRLLTAAACGGLRPPPAGRPRRTTNPTGRPLHLRCSTASISPIFYIDLLLRFVFTRGPTAFTERPALRRPRPRSSHSRAVTPRERSTCLLLVRSSDHLHADAAVVGCSFRTKGATRVGRGRCLPAPVRTQVQPCDCRQSRNSPNLGIRC